MTLRPSSAISLREFLVLAALLAVLVIAMRATFGRSEPPVDANGNPLAARDYGSFDARVQP